MPGTDAQHQSWHNQELLESCKVLWEYSYFINEVRENQKQGLAIETAVQEAQKSCIKKDILKEFLEQNSAEVSDVILEEFDQEKYEEDLRRESWEDGKIAGMEEGKSIGREEGKALEKKELLVNLYRKHLLTLEQAAEEYVQRQRSSKNFYCNVETIWHIVDLYHFYYYTVNIFFPAFSYKAGDISYYLLTPFYFQIKRGFCL